MAITMEFDGKRPLLDIHFEDANGKPKEVYLPTEELDDKTFLLAIIAERLSFIAYLLSEEGDIDEYLREIAYNTGDGGAADKVGALGRIIELLED